MLICCRQENTIENPTSVRDLHKYFHRIKRTYSNVGTLNTVKNKKNINNNRPEKE